MAVIVALFIRGAYTNGVCPQPGVTFGKVLMCGRIEPWLELAASRRQQLHQKMAIPAGRRS